MVQTWTDVIYRALKWTETASATDIVAAIEGYFPGVNRQALINATARYQKLKIWKTSPVIEPKAIERFQDILVHGHVLDDAKRVKFSDLVLALDFADEGEVSRGRVRRRRSAEGRAAQCRPALLRLGGRDRGAARYFAVGCAGRVRRRHRTERLRQEHLAVADRRLARADRRFGAGRRPASRRAEPQDRLHAAAGLSVRVEDDPGERGPRSGNPVRLDGGSPRAGAPAPDPLRARPVH